MIRLSLLWTICLVLAPILVVQGLITRRRAIKLPEAPGPTAGGEGDTHLLVLGDSVVAGVGVESTREALPATLANSLSRVANIDVQWRASGFDGDRLGDLLENLSLQSKLGAKADLVVVNIGVNDVSGLTSMTRWQLQLVHLVSETQRLFNCPLVLVGLPPMGNFPLLPQPLRFALGTRAKMLDLSLFNIASAMSNVIYVPLRLPMKPQYMAIDGYHPSATAIELLSEEIATYLDKEGVLSRLISSSNV